MKAVQQPQTQEFVAGFMPDWRSYWTASEAEQQLEGFKFIGPGWYLPHGSNTDTLLVVPQNRKEEELWHQKWTPDEHFMFCVYNHRNPIAAFNAIINAPERI